MTVVDSMHYARPDQVHALEDLQRRASRSLVGVPAVRDGEEDDIRISVAAVRDQRVRVAVGGGELLGFSTVAPSLDRISRLEALYVDPVWARQGVGGSLLDDAQAIAADEGIVRIEVLATVESVGFFEWAGYARHRTEEVDCAAFVGLWRQL